MASAITLAMALLAIVLFIKGYRGLRESSRIDEFFLMNGELRLGPFVGTLAATNFSLGNMIFLSLIWGYFYGLSGAFWLCVGFILAAAVFIVVVRRSPAVAGYIEDRQNSGSVHEYLYYAYRDNNPTAAKKIRLAASLATVLCLLVALTLEIYLASTIISPLVGVDFVTIFIGLAVLICLYAAMGGFFAVVVTDIIQGALLAVAVSFMTILFITIDLEIESYSSVYATGLGDFVSAPGWTGIAAILGVTAGWYLVTMDTWQRAAASRSADVAVRGMGWGTLALLIGIMAFVLVGMYDALAIAPSLSGEALASHSQGLNPITDIYLLIPTLPFWGEVLVGLIAVCFLMAGISTADTFLVVCGHSLVSDLMIGLGRGESFGDLTENESDLLAGVGRGVIVAMAILVLLMFFGLRWLDLLGNPLALFYLAYSIQFALLAPVVGTLWKIRPKARVVLWSLLLGVVVALLWGFGFALAGVEGVSQFMGHTIDEWVYLAPLPPMVVGFIIIGVGRIFSRGGSHG